MVVTITEQTVKRGRWLATITFLNLAAILLLVFIERIVAERHWLTTLLTYMPQQPFCLPTAALLIIALLTRRWRLAAWNGVATAICLFALLGVNIPKPNFYVHGYRLRVMTLNLHHLSAGTDRSVALIEREKPDILCLQEVSRGTAGDPVAQLAGRLPGWRVARTHDVAIFSRLPIRAQRVHPVPGTGRAMLEAVCEIEGRRFTVLNIHMSTSATPRSLFTRGVSRRSHLRETAAIRSQQVRQILAITPRSPYPVLLAGDFNTPPRGILYRRLRQQFDDAFTRMGWGTGYTFPSRLPVMRIDYIFAGKGLAVVKCCRPAARASDHKAMSAEMYLIEGPD